MDKLVLNGKITRIISREKYGRCLFSFSCAVGGIPRNEWNEITCNSLFSKCYVNLPVKVTGVLQGDSFVADAIEPYYTCDDDIRDFFCTSCYGVGTKIATAVAGFYHGEIFSFSSRTFYESLTNSADEIFAGLKRKPSLSKLSALSDVVTFSRPGFEKLEAFLYPLNISYECVASVYDAFGEDSIQCLKEHPYLTGIQFELSLYAMERIAREAGVHAFSCERISSIVYHCVRSHISSGHTFIDYHKLVEYVQVVSLKYAYRGKIPELVISDALLDQKKFVYRDGLVTFPYIHDAETRVAAVLKSLNIQHGLMHVSDSQISEIESSFEISYSPEQKQAFSLLETSGVKILTGGPGTGKTTLIKGLLSAFSTNAPGKTFALCAPTARAAKRLSDATGYLTDTIHRTIGFNPFDEHTVLRYDRYHPMPYDMVVVDEASMIDILLFQKLIDAVKPGAILLISGDVNQLPSVGPGNVLHDLIACNKFPCVALQTVFRQANQSSIIVNATRILNKKMPLASPDFHLHQVKDSASGFRDLTQFLLDTYDPGAPFSLQLIQPSYKGACGIDAVNTYMQLHQHQNDNCRVDGAPLPGDKVIFLRTDRKFGYANGEVVVIKDITDVSVVVSDGISVYSYSKDVLKDMRLAFSYSVHRAQGCENEIIVIYLPENIPSSLLSNSLLYTAVTRAKKEVHIFYENDALERAIANTQSVSRDSYLAIALAD